MTLFTFGLPQNGFLTTLAYFADTLKRMDPVQILPPFLCLTMSSASVLLMFANE